MTVYSIICGNRIVSNGDYLLLCHHFTLFPVLVAIVLPVISYHCVTCKE
jgi:hypothetical protein